MKICNFVKPEIDYILAQANFTEEESTLFELRVRDIPLEDCAEIMNISDSTVCRIHKRIKDKIKKLNIM